MSLRWSCSECGSFRFKVDSKRNHRLCQPCGARFKLVPAHWVRVYYQKKEPVISPEGADEDFYGGVAWDKKDDGEPLGMPGFHD